MKISSLRFRPALVDALKAYNKTRFTHDVAAGLTVGIVALPLAMAFAIASGAKPEAGIFTAIIGGFLISALGGSRVQIGGPAGAFIVIIYGIIEKYGLGGLLMSTICAGVLLFAMGVFRIGTWIRYIPVPIVIGFTNGIAVLIALSQLKDFFGLSIAKMPGDFFAQIKVLLAHAHTVEPITVAIAVGALVLMFSWPAVFRNNPDGSPKAFRFPRLASILKPIPSPILVLVLGTTAVTVFDLPVETIGSRFGGIPQALPSLQLPPLTWEVVKQLFAPTITIALLGAIESLLCARVADNITGQRHDPNQELMAQGAANFIVPFFGGIPATGTIARTVTNIRTGATSPIAGIVHALSLLVIVLAAAPLATNVPLAALAAILLHVAYNMGEWHEFRRLMDFSMNYRILVLSTFLLTVIFDLTVAVEVGLVLACVFFIYRVSSLTQVEKIPAPALPVWPAPGVVAYSIFGSLFFGAVGKIEVLGQPESDPGKVMILKMTQLINLDTTGLDALETVLKTLQKNGCTLILCGLNHQPLSLMRRTGFLDRLGSENCVEDLTHAIARANTLAG
ncbi:SulP family inorganic anion transporter [Noviherbaspirillum denitrificans]|uniref:Sulfate transporter n=1 Tax=Noviherbaspirillum denitrificans TaxID=1968433 RepID=A0A254TL76_9BURK|nr:SulP family inorganic anion transporter [Noviherbaspirillum denitrificans]OWW22977.1 sulfate transporter [Noviherbaspirillum denitrificans]